MKNIKKLKIYVTGALLLATLATTTGCTKTMDCNIEIDHAHKYQTMYGVETYRVSEKESLGDLQWTEENVPINDELNIMTKYDLIRINDNISSIDKMIAENINYIEYEYKYSYIIMVGKVPVPQTSKKFTPDENHERLTGNIRDVEYAYHAYRTYVDKHGNVKIEKSENVENLYDISSEYPYIKLSDYYDLVQGDPYDKDDIKMK